MYMRYIMEFIIFINAAYCQPRYFPLTMVILTGNLKCLRKGQECISRYGRKETPGYGSRPGECHI